VAPLVNMNPISEEPLVIYTQRTAAGLFVPAPLMIVLVGSLFALRTVMALVIATRLVRSEPEGQFVTPPVSYTPFETQTVSPPPATVIASWILLAAVAQLS